MATETESYPATLDIDYPDKLDRVSTLFRLVLSIPILVLISVLDGSGLDSFTLKSGEQVYTYGTSFALALSAATALMIVFRQRYPKWWFDFALEFNRFASRVGAYLFLLTDKYPSTVETQTVHLDLKYPDVKRDLQWWMPLVKWFLAIPHYFVLAFLLIAACAVTVIAWFVILFTGKYPKDLFDFVVGVGRWCLRVQAYTSLLITDKYPPFSLK